MKIAIGASSFGAANSRPRELLDAAGLEIVANPYGRRLTEAEIIKHLSGAVGLIAGLEPLNRRVFQACPDLKAVARVGIGMDNVDQEAAMEAGIKVSNTPDEPAAAVAELTLTAALALCRRLIPANTSLHQREWKKVVGRSLNGSNVLVVGYGRIGRHVARLMHACGARVSICDPFVEATEIPAGLNYVTFEDGVGVADIISLHASGKDVIFGAPEFRKVRPGALLLNAARGHLIDEDALWAALTDGRLSGAWLDVYWDEPYTGRLADLEHVILTPHVGTYTEECRLAMECAAVENLLRDLGVS